MESTRKALESLDLNDRDAAIRETRCISTISVEGYDTSLKKYALILALRKHFASCGKVLYVSLIRNLKEGILNSVAYMRLEGEGAQKKALELDRTDVGGWRAIVKAVPWPREYSDRSDGTITKQNPHCMMLVSGYDTELSQIDIQIELCQLFSSCGEVTQVNVVPSLGNASVTIVGVGCEENAMALNKCDVEGMDLLVKPLIRSKNIYFKKRRRPDVYGYMPPSHKLELAKEKEKEKEKQKQKKKKKKKMEKQMALF